MVNGLSASVQLPAWRRPRGGGQRSAGAASAGREEGKGKKSTDDGRDTSRDTSRDTEPGAMLPLSSTGREGVLTPKDDKGPQGN